MKRIIIIIMLITIYSCEDKDQQIEMQLMDCVNSRIRMNIFDARAKEFDYYKFTQDIEKQLIEKHILLEKSKKDYINAFTMINKNKLKSVYLSEKELFNSCEDFRFWTSIIFGRCSDSIEITEQYKKELIIFEKLMAEGYDDQVLVLELLNSIENDNFDKIVNRAPVIALLIINFEMKYNNLFKNDESFND